ncbi:ABC transporter substrate-binding protein [Acetobacter vaccinii]|uniref:ABC transporter substrate-binding protein n=1 Tax=Acetobacter vaccinii TaxID=2592655 RepID=A0A5C1YQ50_9PROT|nr:ABC transporter substrate-binding protein [Acetobacter vaccinii]QEO17695.1 ABC transporter substrate-binding protein [Acetobacter vaccinii]
MTGPAPSRFRRRALLSGAGLAAAGAGISLLGAPWHHHHSRQPDGSYRRLRVGWLEADNSPVFAAAQQKDFFAHYNLDIQPVHSTRSGPDILRALEIGELNYAVAPALAWIQALHAGLNAQLIMGVQPGNFRLLVRRTSGITRLDQLMGRTVAIPEQSTVEKLFLAIMMRRKGLDALNRIKWVELPPFPDMDDAAHEDGIDAIITRDPYGWLLLQKKPDLFSELVGSNSGHYAERTSLVLGASTKALGQDPEAATALVLALRDAALWADTHRDDVATMIADNISELSVASARRMLHAEPAIIPVIGKALRTQVAQYCDELQLIGLLPENDDTARLSGLYTANPLRQ